MAAANSEYLKKNREGSLINQVENEKNSTETVSILCVSVAGSFTVRQLDLLE